MRSSSFALSLSILACAGASACADVPASPQVFLQVAPGSLGMPVAIQAKASRCTAGRPSGGCAAREDLLVTIRALRCANASDCSNVRFTDDVGVAMPLVVRPKFLAQVEVEGQRFDIEAEPLGDLDTPASTLLLQPARPASMPQERVIAFRGVPLGILATSEQDRIDERGNERPPAPGSSVEVRAELNGVAVTATNLGGGGYLRLVPEAAGELVVTNYLKKPAVALDEARLKIHDPAEVRDVEFIDQACVGEGLIARRKGDRWEVAFLPLGRVAGARGVLSAASVQLAGAVGSVTPDGLVTLEAEPSADTALVIELGGRTYRTPIGTGPCVAR
jgi:hypothetical protein